MGPAIDAADLYFQHSRSESWTLEEGKSTICRFELADIRSIAIERHSPLCLIIVVNPPKPG